MIIKQNEAERLEALRQLNLLDSGESEAFNRIARIASRLFNTPHAMVSLMDQDRQWFKSRIGVPMTEIPRSSAFCNYVIQKDEVMVVPDATQDERFADFPFVADDPNIRFYAGAPLVTPDGYAIGSVCVLDNKPRDLSPEDQRMLADLAAIVMAQIELSHAVGHIDPFSNLPNRNQLYEDLDDLAREHPGMRHLMIVVDIMGVDRLEEILQALGSTYSDALVRISARLIRETIGAEITLYHLDTARYVFMLPDRQEKNWLSIVDNLTSCFPQPIVCDGIPIDVNLGIGLSPFKLGEINGPDIVRTAITAALEAREQERSWAIYNPAADNARRRAFTLLSDIPQALAASDQFHMVYQPRIDLHDDSYPCAEALLRWNHPTLGNISPGEFIPLVEQTALATPLTRWVIQAVLAQIAQWQKSGISMRISINVSARNLEEPDFAENLSAALRLHELSPETIELEFTESALMRNGTAILKQLNAIRAMGVQIAIDDFGTGYSNHSYLQQIPASIVKLDQSMIKTLCSSPRDQIIVRSMIEMAHALGYRVVAEGVETRAEYDLLKKWSCDEIQGYLVARPMNVAAFEEWRQKTDFIP